MEYLDDDEVSSLLPLLDCVGDWSPCSLILPGSSHSPGSGRMLTVCARGLLACEMHA